MIIECIIFYCLLVFDFFAWFYFYFRAINYHNDRALNIKRIFTILYYCLVQVYNIYMLLNLKYLDLKSNDLLLIFIRMSVIVNICLVFYFMFSLKLPPKR